MATDKQKAFVAAYLSNGLNATEAARQAGYKGNDVTLASVGYENLRKPQIRDEINKAMNHRAMTRDEVLHRISEQARGNMGDFLRIEPRVRPKYVMVTKEGGEIEWKEEPDHYTVIELDLEQAKALGKLGLIKRFKEGKDGISFELYSSQTALEMLARAHGIYEIQDRSDKTLMEQMHEAMTQEVGEYSGDRSE